MNAPDPDGSGLDVDGRKRYIHRYIAIVKKNPPPERMDIRLALAANIPTEETNVNIS
jgi:hypothetical protein